jgi:hypothetical protein
LRLADVLDTEHKAVGASNSNIIGELTFGDALAIFQDRQRTAAVIKDGMKAYNEPAAADLLKTGMGWNRPT